jgi:hypothetical protein
MCFSAEADVIAAAAIGAVGVDALRHVTDRRQLALASLPALFAAHQLTEAFVWGGLEGGASAEAGRIAMWLYLAFAFWVLPVLAPLAVRAVEPDPGRRRLMGICAAVGAAIALAYLVAMARGPVWAEVDGRHIAYFFPPTGPGELVDGLYVIVGCVPFLASSRRALVTFGWLNVAAMVALFWLTQTGKISLWCVWAAVTSVVIAAHLRNTRRTTPESSGTSAPPPAWRRLVPGGSAPPPPPLQS